MLYREVTEDNCGIYMIRNKKNGKVYIGQSHNIKWRWISHRSALNAGRCSNRHLQSAWNLYGCSCFEFLIVELCSVSELDIREEYWITHYASIENGYNIRRGGNSSRGWKMTVEQCEHISKALTGRKFSNEHCDAISAAKKEYYKSHLPSTSRTVVCLNTHEVFANATKACEKYPSADPSAIHSCCKNNRLRSSGKLNGQNLVWAYFDDYKRMSHAEIQQRIENVGYVVSAKKSMRPVICTTTGLRFQSAKEASGYYNIKSCGICDCLHGRQKTSGRDPVTNKPLQWAYCN